MSDYLFRGETISGPAAWMLLGSIKRVLTECPDPTLEDVLVLSGIVKDFEEKFDEDLKSAYPDPDMDWSEYEEWCK